jgi:hypothetical protein
MRRYELLKHPIAVRRLAGVALASDRFSYPSTRR